MRDASRRIVQINREHRAVEAAVKGLLRHALRCGDLLIEAKKEVPHGSWAPWLEKNFDGSDWTARKYMQLARLETREPGSILQFSSIRQALRSFHPDDCPAIRVTVGTTAAESVAASIRFAKGALAHADLDPADPVFAKRVEYLAAAVDDLLDAAGLEDGSRERRQRPSAQKGRSICSIDECNTGATARGLCPKHYRRWRIHGDPLFTLRPGRRALVRS